MSDSTFSRPTDGLRIAVKLNMLHSNDTLEERLTVLRDIGLDGVELSINDAARAQEVGEAVTTSGLPVATLIVGESFAHSLTSSRVEDRAVVIDAIRRNIRYAADIGTEALMLSPGFAYPTVPLQQTRDRVVSALLPLAEEAISAGVWLGMENLWNGWLLSPTDMANLVDDLGCPPFSVHFDIGNAMRFGWPEHWVEVLDGRIKRLDIKDFSHNLAMTQATRYGVHQELVATWGPGPWGALDAELLDGDVEWQRIAGVIARSGYTGWLCAEVAGGDESRIRAVKAQLDAIRSLVAAASHC